MGVRQNNKSSVDNAHLDERRQRSGRCERFGGAHAGAENLPTDGLRLEPARKTFEETFEQLSPLQRLLLARRLGYESFDSLLAASTVVTLSDGSAWWLSADRHGEWTAWNLCTLGLQDGRKSGETFVADQNAG